MSRTKHFAWCDRCLRGSPMYAFDAPLVARFFAIEELRAAGWKHVVDGGSLSAPRPAPVPRLPQSRLGKGTREEAERMWSAATYCPECASRMTRDAREPREVRDARAASSPRAAHQRVS